MNEKDAAFVGLHGVRDNMSRKLREVGASYRGGEQGGRRKLWSSGLLGIDSPRSLKLKVKCWSVLYILRMALKTDLGATRIRQPTKLYVSMLNMAIHNFSESF